MAVKFETFVASKVGKGVTQVHLRKQDGAGSLESRELLYEDEAKTKPVMGNEQFEYQGLSDDSVNGTDAETLITDIMEACEGDSQKAARIFRKGFNDVSRSETGGTDPYTKAAKGLAKLAEAGKIPELAGLTEADIISWIKSRQSK